MDKPLIELDAKSIKPFDILVAKVLAEDYFNQTDEEQTDTTYEAYCCGFCAGIAYVKELAKSTPEQLEEFSRSVNIYVNGKDAQEL